jgi:hypothetical protein
MQTYFEALRHRGRNRRNLRAAMLGAKPSIRARSNGSVIHETESMRWQSNTQRS